MLSDDVIGKHRMTTRTEIGSFIIPLGWRGILESVASRTQFYAGPGSVEVDCHGSVAVSVARRRTSCEFFHMQFGVLALLTASK